MGARPKDRGVTQQELIAIQAFLETGSKTKAYRKAYPNVKMKGDALHSNAKKLFRRTPVRLRLEAEQEKLRNRHQGMVDRIAEEMGRLAFSNMMDYGAPQADGTFLVDLSKLTREQAAAIKEVSTDTVLSSDPDALDASGKGDGDRKQKVAVFNTKIRLHDTKLSALVQLGTHFGMFKKGGDGGEGNNKPAHGSEPVSASAEWLKKVLGEGTDGEDS
jgi:terminase small subunit-like protein